MSLRRLIFVVAVLAATSVIPSRAAAAAPQPVVDGNRIVDALTSKRFVPHGVNFPGYEYRCQQGWDYGEDGTKPHEVASTVAAIASWKINTVRLPLNQDCWLGDDGLPSGGLTVAGYRQSVENFVDALNQVGIVAIIDLHWSGPNGVAADGLRPMPDNRTAAFWHSVATRFQQNRSVIFDLFNEPHSRWGGNGWTFELKWDCWAKGGCEAPSEADTAPVSGVLPRYEAAGFRKLTSVVRSVGATQPILLSGIDWANDLRGWLAHAPADDQLIASFHNYPIQRCSTGRCWDEEIATVAERVPVLAAEIGQNDCGNPGHVNRFMKWADARLIGYLVWAWWDLPTLGCSNFALISDLDGTPLAPVGTAFHAHLASLPDELPEPAPRAGPGLAIKTARWNGKSLRLAIRIDSKASKAVTARVRLVRDPRSKQPPRVKVRLITRRVRSLTGMSWLNINIPRGLRPTFVTVMYPGDRLLRASTISRKPASVSKVTR